MSTQDIVTQIEAALEGTTPGPWANDGCYVRSEHREHFDWKIPGTTRDANLIAQAPTLLREAAATITRLSAVLRRARPYVVDAMNAAEESDYVVGEEAASQLQDDIDALLGSGAGEGEQR